VSRLATAAAAVALVVAMLAGGASVVLEADEVTGAAVVALGGVTFAAVGALLVHRRRENAVGWLLASYGLLFCMNLAFYADIARVQATGVSTPTVGISSLFHAVGWLAGLALLAVALLVFPTGRPPGQRWRLVGWLAGAGGAGVFTAFVLLWGHRGVELASSGDLPGPAARVFLGSQVLVSAALVLGLASLVVRYRRAQMEERLQLKWLLFAAVPLLAGPVLFAVTGTAPGDPGAEVAELVIVGGLYGVPIAIGIAILKHRLYEIDRLISRTVAYAVISALLVAVYTGGVFLLTPMVAGMGGGSELAVAASTLAVAAAFGPVRRRVQDVVDRRFNRARYDAQRTVSSFAGRLRDEVHLEDLRAELVGVVDEVMEPASASLWLRGGAVR
jgi:hypothetical protein